MILTVAGCPGTDGGSGTGGNGSQFNVPPRVVLTVAPDPPRGVAPLRVQFDSSQSTDDGIIVDRAWDFGDGTTSRETAPLKTYDRNGVYTVRLTLTDDLGATSFTTTTARVSEAPIAIFTVAFVPADGGPLVPGQTTAANSPATFEFDASSSFDPDGATGDRLTFAWQFGDGVTASTSPARHTFARAGAYRVQLTVTDATGIRSDTEVFIEVGIPQPTLLFRSPPASLAEIALSRRASLWTYIAFSVEPGVPYTLRAGLDPDTSPDNGNDIPLDTDAFDGVLVRDLPLTYPTPLDLNLDPNIPLGTYNLWTELRTDRTAPERAYATTRIRLVAPPPNGFASAPRVPLFRAADGLDRGYALMPNASPTQRRFVFSIGRLEQGDRLFLSFFSTPGYVENFNAQAYRVQLFTADGRMFLTLLDAIDPSGILPPQLFTRDSSFLISTTSDDYFVAVEPLRERDPPQSLSVAVRRRAVSPTFRPPTQRVYLNFEGADSVAVSPSAETFPIPPLEIGTAAAPRDDAVIKQVAIQRVRDLLAPYNVVVTSSFDPNDPATPVAPPPTPFTQVFFNNTTTWVPAVIPQSLLLVFGRPDFADPRNLTQTGTAVVAANVLVAFANAPATLRDDAALGRALGNSAVHQLGMMFGLQETVGPPEDIMFFGTAIDGPFLFSDSTEFSATGDPGEGAFGDPTLGVQNAPAYLLEVLGPAAP